MKQWIKRLSVLLLLLILAGSAVGCRTDGEREFHSLEDLEDATIGVVTGTSWDLIVQRSFPNAPRKYFSSVADALLALEQGKIDTFFADKTLYAGMHWENDKISCIDEPLENVINAMILAKEGYDEELLAQLNAFVAKAREDGTIERLTDKWLGESEPEEHPDYNSLTGENGTLKIAVGNSMKPVAYQRGSLYTGYDVEFITLFAEEYGYKLEVEGMTFEALIPSVSSGKFDIGACGITVTPERAESVTFADNHFETHGVAVIRAPYYGMGNRAFQTLDDFSGEKVGVMTGTLWDGVAKKELPGAQIKHFSGTADLLLALDQNKVAGVIGPKTFYATARWENVPVRIVDETETSILSGFMLAKDDYDRTLLSQLNEFIAKAKADGTTEDLYEKWLADEEPTQHPDYRSLSGENGTLKIAVDNTAKPMVYRKNDTFTGLDVEILTRFAEEYGYALEFEGMSFEALIPYVSEGKCDMGACGIAITPERAESVTFTDSYIELEGVVMVSETSVSSEENSFFENISDSFEKTFIREDRWKLILEGVCVTLIISVCSGIFGTALGLGLYMLSRSSVRAVRALAKGFAKVYSRIVAGTPIVVILMILFYVVFGKVRDINGIVVAIIGFSLTFGAFVYDHVAVSVSSVDKGQTEAAYALGYTKSKTFFHIVLPQAMKIFMPSYCAHAVELVKATAVVGYIAVNDLTKMGDIIRSNTYEAFFPLIATAIIYFLLTWGLSLLLKLAAKRFEPKRRKENDILKGVKTV